MFVATTALILLSGPTGDLIKNSLNLELKLDVIEAFEHGPVILDVTITNRGKQPLKVRTYRLMHQSSIAPPVEWKAWAPVPYVCAGSQEDQIFETGMRLTERHILHHEFVSVFPAGKYRVIVNLVLLGPPKPDEVGWHILAMPRKTFEVTISPATPANRWALAARLEAEFAALPTDVESSLHNPLEDVGNKLSGTPHKELMPLALRMMNRVRMDEPFPLNGSFRQQMVGFVFRADAKAAHRFFVDALLANPRRADPRDVFPIWETTVPDMIEIGRGYLQRVTDPKMWLSPAHWHYFWPEEEVTSFLRWATFSPPLILPAQELKRIASAKDFTVRAWTYSVFGRRLGAEWCAEFLKEARRVAQSSPDPKKPGTIDSALRYLIFSLCLHPNDPHERKLFNIFLSGAEDNVIARAAREEFAERKNDIQERKR